MKWTDISTDRVETVWHNLFGETIQLHQDYLLDDTLKSRPVVVGYRYILNYVVEALIIALFLIGIWMGRKQRFLWMILSNLYHGSALAVCHSHLHRLYLQICQCQVAQTTQGCHRSPGRIPFGMEWLLVCHQLTIM